jgi:hypothetical protein
LYVADTSLRRGAVSCSSSLCSSGREAYPVSTSLGEVQHRCMGFVSNSRGIGSCVSGMPSFVGQSDSYVSDLRQGEVPSSVRGSSISITVKSNRGNSSDSVDTRVLKKTGGMRPVIDLSILNSYLSVPHFKMETNRSIGACILPGMLTTKLDLSDAYFHIPISLASRKFLRFVWNNKVYQFLAVTFGLAVAPQDFTQVFQTVTAHLHTLSVQAHSYLDDSLLKEFDSEILSRHTCLFIRLLLDLGILISYILLNNVRKRTKNDLQNITLRSSNTNPTRNWG